MHSHTKPPVVVVETVTLSFRLPQNLHEKIAAAAEADRRSIAGWIRVACERELRNSQPGRA
jgi:predicted HicB family RNase H-like nuclease